MTPDPQRSFVANLAEVVREHGGRLAIETIEGTRVTYAELWQRVNELRAHYVRRGLKRGDVVAVLLPRSVDFVAGIIAAWSCEAVALPLDVAAPAQRLDFILNEARPVLVLREGDVVSVGAESADEMPVHALTAPAYLIYTSGSTGRPKGVLVSHAGLTAVLAAQIELFQISEESRCFWLHGTGFDASLSDIGTALLAGAELCFAEGGGLNQDARALAVCLRQARITHIDLPPALLPYLDEAALPESLGTIIIGGEVCAAAVIRRWAARLRLINVYGPTEATICTSMIVCDSEWQRPWIGEPLPGLTYEVCDEAGAQVADGTPGELWISGAAVALGYPWLPELSGERFVRGGRTYRTGDRVVKHAAGGFEFLGRVDRQFKLDGRLICPEEVERALLDTGLARRAYVLRWHQGRRKLLAAVVETAATDAAPLRAALQTRLPAWMVPTMWQLTPLMPCLTNGKPDVMALGDLLAEQARSRPPVTDAMTEDEAAIASVFEAALQLPRIRLHEDFFTDLGGDSLAVVAAIALAAERGLPLPADAIHRGRTVAGVAKLMHESEAMPREALMREVEAACAVMAESFVTAAPAKPICILLTGATGFLGGAVLGELLRQSTARVICLGRGEAKELRQRVMASATEHGFAELLVNEEPRWSVVSGDIGEARFGTEHWETLAGEVDAVVHLAAEVRLFEPYAALKPSQVGGTLNVLHFCATGRAKVLHVASSLSVFVDADPVTSWCREDDLRREITQVHGGYAQSKWVAEQIVLLAGERGLGAGIHRLGLLTVNAATGAGPARDWLTLALPGLLQPVADASRPTLEFDVTPVDYAARVLGHLVVQGSLGVHHIANPQPVTQAQIADLQGHAAASGAATLAGLRSRERGGFHRSLDLFKSSQVRFQLDRVARALAGSGIQFPEITPEYLRLCLRHAEMAATSTS